MKRLFAVLLAVLMVFSLVACTKAPADNTTDGSKDTTAGAVNKDNTSGNNDDSVSGGDEVTYLGEVEVMKGEAASAGLCVGWMPDLIRERAGVDMIGLPGDNSQVDSYLAAGELPDVTVLDGIDRIEAAIEGGMVIDLETVKDKLPNVFDTYYDACIDMINFNKEFYSAGTGKVYGLSRQFTSYSLPTVDNGGIFLRYDVYGEVGYPEIKNYDDLFNCLKAMQEACPTAEDGTKIYAISYFDEWDTGSTSAYGYVSRSMGYYSQGLWSIDMHDYDGTIESMKVVNNISDDSDYKQFLQFMFECNQAGLVDPNSLTQKFDDAKAKCMNGYTLLQWDNWGTTWNSDLQNEGKGFRRVPLSDCFVGQDAIAQPSSTCMIAISSTCKNLDAACALINYMFDPEFTISYMNGPRFQVWDYDENMTPYFVEGGYEAMNNLDFTQRGCIIMLTYNFSGQMPGSPDGITSDYSTWPSFAEMVADGTIVETKLMTDWKEHTSSGEHLLYTALDKEGKTVVPPAKLNHTKTTDEQMAESRIGERVVTGSWACMFASSQDEFDAAWQSMVEDTQGMGIEEFIAQQWIYYQEGVEAMAPYVKG